MTLAARLRRRAAGLAELLSFLSERKLWWLAPVVLAVAAVAFLLFLATQPQVTPFIYTLF